MSFNFPAKLEQKLDALSPQKFVRVTSFLGGNITREKADDHGGRLDVLRNAWIIADFPTRLPEAKPYFEWLDAAIKAVVRLEEPPPLPVIQGSVASDLGFHFPSELQRKLEALSGRQFANVVIHLGGEISREKAEDEDKRLDVLHNAWILADFPSRRAEAQPYFDWLNEVIKAVVRYEDPPPWPSKELQKLQKTAEALQRGGPAPAPQQAVTASGATPLLQAVLQALKEGGSAEEQDIAQWLEQTAARTKDKQQAAEYGAVLDQIKTSPTTPPAGTQVPDWNPEELRGELEAFFTKQDPTLPVEFLTRAVACTPAVCKVVVPRYFEGRTWHDTSGTGWIIGPDLLITNYHVIHARRQNGFNNEKDASKEDFDLQAQHCRMHFDHFGEKDSEPLSAVLLESDRELDFVLFRLTKSQPQRPPLRLSARFMMRSREEGGLEAGVNILQHPRGKGMRVAFRDNYVLSGDEKLLVYLTGTDLGSSGSPVFDDDWQVVALHAGSKFVDGGGFNVNGNPVRLVNYGIPIKTILEHLGKKRPDLHAEILASQPPPPLE